MLIKWSQILSCVITGSSACSNVLADSQPKQVSLLLSPSLHSSNEVIELSQQLYHDDNTTDFVNIIIIIVIAIWIHAAQNHNANIDCCYNVTYAGNWQQCRCNVVWLNCETCFRVFGWYWFDYVPRQQLEASRCYYGVIRKGCLHKNSENVHTSSSLSSSFCSGPFLAVPSSITVRTEFILVIYYAGCV